MRALDEQWFAELMELVQQNNDWEKLNKSLQINQSERERFFEDEVENPHFKYFYNDARVQNKDKYHTFLKRIAATESDPVVRDLYVEKLKAQLARIAMMEASAAGDDATFTKESVAIYGQPKKEFFAYIAKRITEQCDVTEESFKAPAAERLYTIFSKIDHSKTKVSNDFLPEPVDGGDEMIDGYLAQEIFETALKEYDIEGWRVIVDTTQSRRVFSVVPARQEIYIPSEHNLINRPEPLTRLKAEAVAEHEVGVHVRRSYAGAQSQLKLLSIGLQGYLRGEEGLASYVQQQVEGAKEFYGFERYLAASLAWGLDGKKRDFRSVYAVLLDYFILVAKDKKLVDEGNVKRAAWDATVRVFRGTSATTPGCIYTRDLAYLEGNIGMWQLLIDKPHVFEHLFVGKFDPLSNTHVSALQSLGILPEW